MSLERLESYFSSEAVAPQTAAASRGEREKGPIGSPPPPPPRTRTAEEAVDIHNVVTVSPAGRPTDGLRSAAAAGGALLSRGRKASINCL